MNITIKLSNQTITLNVPDTEKDITIDLSKTDQLDNRLTHHGVPKPFVNIHPRNNNKPKFAWHHHIMNIVNTLGFTYSNGNNKHMYVYVPATIAGPNAAIIHLSNILPKGFTASVCGTHNEVRIANLFSL